MASLYFFYSAMNAGKTTSLLQTDYNYHECGMDTVIFVPEVYSRGDACGVVESRIGLNKEAITFDKRFDFFDCVRGLKNIACVLVDEAQFLTSVQVDQLGDIVDRLDIPVLTYGLRSDFKGDAFEGSMRLLTIADVLTELKTICHCGRKATMNMRLDGHGHKIVEGNQVEIAKDRYISVCRRHFKDPVSTKC